MEPCELTLREAGDAIRGRRLSARELATSALSRIGSTEPSIHAYVEILAEQALASADVADRDLAAGIDRGPLHGIPIAVKDNFDLAGVPTRCGSRVRQEAEPAVADAESVRRARAGGAVLVGKTVTQEFAAGVVSPPARNPWDPSRIPGGSSGGSAATVANGGALAAFGSDTGGSIRIPAAVCGVVGLKPTFGAVSVAGVYPLAWSLDTVGPIARTVEDAALFFDVIRDPNPAPPSTSELRSRLDAVRIGVERTFFAARLQSDVRHAFDDALELLADLGASLVEVDWPDAQLAGASSFVINRVETAGVHDRGLRRHPELYGPELRLRLEASALFPTGGYLRAQQARRRIRESMAILFNTHRLDVLVGPTLPGVAAPADDLFVAHDDGSRESVMLAYIRMTRPFNVTGQPATSVPCGFDQMGLPIGLQMAGRPWREPALCGIAHAYEQAAGFYLRRPSTAEQIAAV